MNREDIVALFARRDDAWRRRDAVALTGDHAEDGVAESPMQGRLVGRARIGNVYESWFKAFPDLSFTARDLVIDANRVAQFYSVRGTQMSPFGGVPATGRRIDFKGAWLYTLSPDGLITHDQRLYDVTAMLVQLDVLKAKPGGLGFPQPTSTSGSSQETAHRSDKGARMARKDIVALFARRADAWNRHDAATLVADHAEQAVAESPIRGHLEGRALIKEVYENWFASFQDLTYAPKDLVIDGDRVAQFFSIRATQSAPFAGVPATGRRIDFSGVALFTIGPEGLITHDERLYDVTAVMVQLGLLKAKPAED